MCRSRSIAMSCSGVSRSALTLQSVMSCTKQHQAEIGFSGRRPRRRRSKCVARHSSASVAVASCCDTPNVRGAKGLPTSVMCVDGASAPGANQRLWWCRVQAEPQSELGATPTSSRRRCRQIPLHGGQAEAPDTRFRAIAEAQQLEKRRSTARWSKLNLR